MIGSISPPTTARARRAAELLGRRRARMRKTIDEQEDEEPREADRKAEQEADTNDPSTGAQDTKGVEQKEQQAHRKEPGQAGKAQGSARVWSNRRAGGDRGADSPSGRMCTVWAIPTAGCPAAGLHRALRDRYYLVLPPVPPVWSLPTPCTRTWTASAAVVIGRVPSRDVARTKKAGRSRSPNGTWSVPGW